MGRSTNEHPNEQGQTGTSKQTRTSTNEWGMSRNVYGGPQTCRDKHEQVATSANKWGRAQMRAGRAGEHEQGNGSSYHDSGAPLFFT
jgi:hypothetical protein